MVAYTMAMENEMKKTDLVCTLDIEKETKWDIKNKT